MTRANGSIYAGIRDSDGHIERLFGNEGKKFEVLVGMAAGSWISPRQVLDHIANTTLMDTTTIKLKLLSGCTLIGSAAALVLAAPAASAQHKAPAVAACAAASALQPFPAALAVYEARLFELTEPDEKKYDARFTRQLRSLVAPQVARNSKFLATVTSGPTDVGAYVVSGQRAYVYYGVCQAHQCDNTTMDILFDPARNRMVGKLRDRCMAAWLGQPDIAEMALLDQCHRAAFRAAVTACAGEK